MLLGLGKGGAAQAYLVDFGLACHYTTSATFKPDPKKMHNGTIEYTSRDAHHGVPTMRGDLEILAYNLVNWFGHKLPWELDAKLLATPTKVQALKEAFMSDTAASLAKAFIQPPPAAVSQYFNYVASLRFNDQPDYVKCRRIFETALSAMKRANSGDLEFGKCVAAAKKTPPVKKTTPAKVAPAATSRKRSYATAAEDKTNTSSIEITDSEDEEQAAAAAAKPTPKKAKKPSSAKKSSPPPPVQTPEPPKKTRKDKIYEVNMLDISYDADVVINIRRRGDSKARKFVFQNADVAGKTTPGKVAPSTPLGTAATPDKKTKKKREIFVDLEQSVTGNVINIKAKKRSDTPKKTPSATRKSPRT